ncbi:MAG: hypothetical protein IPN74_12805 [Haliscomenobacter sp.]|nr:hypothetical protein [Haliscomenobacter sp.]
MKAPEAILRAFVAEKLHDDASLQPDEAVLRVLNAVVALEPGASREAEEVRSIEIVEDTDGTYAAKSIKLFNLMKVSQHDLMGFLLKETTVFLTEDNRLKIVLSLLNLLYEFFPKLTYAFNEQDAKILFAVYSVGTSAFHPSEVAAAYLKRFGQPLPDAQLTRSLAFFKDLFVVKYLGDGKYLLRENITYERH